MKPSSHQHMDTHPYAFAANKTSEGCNGASKTFFISKETRLEMDAHTRSLLIKLFLEIGVVVNK